MRRPSLTLRVSQHHRAVPRRTLTLVASTGRTGTKNKLRLELIGAVVIAGEPVSPPDWSRRVADCEERVVKIRPLFAAAAVSAGLAAPASPAVAAEPPKKPVFGFGALKPATPEAAREKAAAWLKSV